jgi:hypothetical protein
MKIELETLIEIVTREVIKELVSRGYSIEQLTSRNREEKKMQKKSFEVDMSEFVTPVLTEQQMDVLDNGIEELVIPPQTIITPGANRLIKNKKIKLIYKS